MTISRSLVAGLLSIACATHIHANVLEGISFFSQRSQSTNAARDLVGWHPYINVYGAQDNYATTAFTWAYNRSVKPFWIMNALFGTDTIRVSGSFITERAREAVLADYFGLSPAFDSVVQFDPTIQSVTTAWSAFLGLDDITPGLFIKINIPLVWTRWVIEMQEEVFSSGENTPFPAGYMDVDTVTAPITSFTQALTGRVRFGQMQDPLRFGKLNGAQSEWGMSDVQFSLGWNFILEENGHAGFALRASAPTGSRPDSEYFFEPIIGNGKHWEFGLGFSGDARLWEKDGEQELRFFGEVNIMHICKARQRRSFDVCPNGFGSRFILVKEFNPLTQYINKLSPLINKTTLPCNVRNDLQVDIVFMIGYQYRGFLADVGYNGWIRSKEKVTIQQELPGFAYGLKGIQDVFAVGMPSRATQSSATFMGNEIIEQPIVVDNPSPVFLFPLQLNPHSAASPRLITHKLFAHLSYGIEDCWSWIVPYFGLGAEIEFQGINRSNMVQTDKTTMQQWGIWFKGGWYFE